MGRCNIVGTTLTFVPSKLSCQQSYAADIVPDHAQFLASVLCGDTEKVKIFLARADINVNILSLVSISHHHFFVLANRVHHSRKCKLYIVFYL